MDIFDDILRGLVYAGPRYSDSGRDTLNGRTPSLELAQHYPIPEDLTDETLRQKLNWYPLAYADETEAVFHRIAEEEGISIGPLPPTLVVATALRLTRPLAF